MEKSLTDIKGIGKKRAEILETMGVKTPEDLLEFLPRDYVDLTKITPISEVEDEQTVLVSGTVCSDIQTKYTGKIALYIFEVSDDSPEQFGYPSTVRVTLFNQKFTADKLSRGTRVYLYGKAQVFGRFADMKSPKVETDYEYGLRAIYPLKAGISRRLISNSLKCLLFGSMQKLPDIRSEGMVTAEIEDALPLPMREKYRLCPAKQAFLDIHFPTDLSQVQNARKRLAFEELLLFQICLRMMKKRIKQQPAPKLEKKDLRPFQKALPFTLTEAQRRVIEEAMKDMTREVPMSRVVQGDVGSGKTAVAAALCYFAFQNGGQACLMAPTEILAIQHFNDLEPLLAKFHIVVALMTGSTPKKEKSTIKTALSQGKIHLIIGTHSLIEEDVIFQNLTLAVTDEQHRFGVNQRAALSAKGKNGLCPHVLVMSATPIPRSLAMILYGDMDLSVIDQLPPGRKKVSTFLLDSEYNRKMYGYVAEEVNRGNQAYVVCPLVEEGENINLKAVESFAEELKKDYLPPEKVKVGYMHGKMPPKLKDQVLKDFAENKINLLVSTTVIEVGVNVPNATVMIIQNAERFGLSQLHQLRGRVGRSDKKSYCFLISDAKNPETRERLNAFCRNNDGFEISKTDLQLRGPGDFFGNRQHGLPPFKIADLVNDMDLFLSAREAADALMADPQWHKQPENQALKHKAAKLFLLADRQTKSANTI